MKILPSDVCRCHDDLCPEHVTCLRWLQNGPNHCGERTPHAASLLIPGAPPGSECRYYVEAPPEADTLLEVLTG